MLAAPRSPRETFELFGLIHEQTDLSSVLDQVDWAGVSPNQIYHAVLGRPPKSAQHTVAGDGYSARDHFLHSLTSKEFQNGIRERLLNAFPEKRRIVFIHIPKCAGTDLKLKLRKQYPQVYYDLVSPHWTPRPVLLRYLKDFGTKIKQSDSIFVHGHVPLNWYMDLGLCRFGDKLLTVIRDPLELIISQVNYVFKRFLENPRCEVHDVRQWANLLGIQEFDPQTPKTELVAMGLRILHDQRIVTPNYLCNFLGLGDAKSALDLAARSNIEITDISRYSEWLSDSWGVQTINANKSPSILSLEELPRDDLEYITQISSEDIALYRHIMQRLVRREANYICGTELVRPDRPVVAELNKVLAEGASE